MTDRKPGFLRQAGLLGNVLSTGFTGGVCLAISLFLGYKIDQYFACEPYGILGGILLGLAAALLQTMKQFKESMGAFTRERNNQEKDSQLQGPDQ